MILFRKSISISIMIQIKSIIPNAACDRQTQGYNKHRALSQRGAGKNRLAKSHSYCIFSARKPLILGPVANSRPEVTGVDDDDALGWRCCCCLLTADITCDVTAAAAEAGAGGGM